MARGSLTFPTRFRQRDVATVYRLATLTAALGFGLGTSLAHATISVLQPLREAAAQLPLELTLLYSDDDKQPLTIDVPKALNVTLTNGDLPPQPLALQREPNVPDKLTLHPGSKAESGGNSKSPTYTTHLEFSGSFDQIGEFVRDLENRFPTAEIQSLVVSGNADDSNMRRVLTYVVENGERFDAGVRLDCLDALKAQARDAQVRKALLLAARKDQNPAVRMKALEALKDSASDDAVREAMLDALAHDANPGVRVEVVNMLVHSLGRESQASSVVSYPELAGAPENMDDQSDDIQISSSNESSAMTSNASVEKVIRTLEELQKRDPSRYVRLRSAAALRQIGPREPQ